MNPKRLVAMAIVLVAAGVVDAAEEVPGHAPADTSVARDTSIKGYPYAYYTPETEFALGVGGIATFYTSAEKQLQPSKVVLSAYYTTNDQYKITLNPEFYFSRNRYFTGMTLSFGHFVDKFWGIGNDTSETGDERYVADRYSIQLVVETPPIFFVSDRAGLIYDFQSSEIVDPEDNAALLAGEVTGSDGGIVSGAGGTWIWDRRDHSFYPTSGDLHTLKLIVYTSASGSDFTYWYFEHDDRRYLSLGPDKVLALQAYVAVAVGDAPFDKLPALGGQHRMRGYYEGRYRDQAFLTGQVEYRHMFARRWGFVVFGALGDVAPDLTRFHGPSFKLAGGAGLRFRFNEEEKVNLRVDLGIGNDTSGVYFGLEEAF